jgi:hypothetical protein
MKQSSNPPSYRPVLRCNILLRLETNQQSLGIKQSGHQQRMHYAFWLWRWQPSSLYPGPLIRTFIGINPVKIFRPESQQLNSRLPGCSKVYIGSLKSNIIQHYLLKCLYNAHTGGYSAEEMARKVSIIDEEGKAYMRCKEKICRKIKCCWIPFLQKPLSGYATSKCITLCSTSTKAR